MQADILFDNLLIVDDIYLADQWTSQTYDIIYRIYLFMEIFPIFFINYSKYKTFCNADGFLKPCVGNK